MNSRTTKANRRLPLHARDVVSLVVALLFIGPLVWLVLGSLQQPGQASPALSLFPNPVSLSNYGQVFQVYDLVRPIFNSFVVVLAAVPLTIITASCAGFAMSQLEGPLRQRLVLLTVILMIVPIPALWLPRFVMFSTVGWIDSLFALIVPSLMGSSPFFVLLFYWTFRRIQGNLFDAARLDGASVLQIWWRVALPLARAATTVVAVLAFALYWNDYMSSLIFLRSEAVYTLSLRLQQFMTQDVATQPLAMAATVLAILPVVALFLWVQRYLWPDGRS